MLVRPFLVMLLGSVLGPAMGIAVFLWMYGN